MVARSTAGAGPGRSHTLTRRLLDAVLLERSVYRSAALHGRNVEAAVVVVVVSMGLGVGTFVGWALAGSPPKGLLVGIIVEPIVTLAAWLGGSATAWLAGRRLGSPDRGVTGFWPVARALALAQTPNLIGLLAVLPVPYRSGLWLLARLWLLIASSSAIRETLGLSEGRALSVLLVSAAVYAALLIGIFGALSLVGVDGVLSISGGLAL